MKNDYDVQIRSRGRGLQPVEILLEVVAVVAILSMFVWGAP